ncbi:MAG: hypothetical protein DWQ37_12495 [Planctomycetota bacterium]|nr:MAG: hypothetical protein DWQ37_12495 [Planctomycetota bacterium]
MNDEPAPQPPPQWSPEARTWASLLLFAHLFAIVLTVTSYTQPSVLQGQVHALFETYLRNLHLTANPVSYPYARFHLTHALAGDVDFSVEVEAQHADGTTETITLPPDVQPLVRVRRYQALANAAGTLADDQFSEGISTILAKTIAGSTLRREEATGGTIRIRSHLLPELQNVSSLEQIARAMRENVTTAYEADVIVSDTSVELLRRSTTLEVAPAEGASRGASGRQPAQDARERQP